MERRIGQKFILHNRIGHGSFGDLYSGEHLLTHEKVAVKLEHFQTRPPQLFYESKIYKVLSGSVGIPALKWYGVEDEYNVMVIDLLERSVEDLFADCAYHFSLKTVLMIADQMIARMQYVHSKNFIHRDIKPDNFMIGKDTNQNMLYLIDFGLSKKYRDPKTGEHIPYREGKMLTGTARYTSVNVHRGIEQSRRDDLESIAYVLIYLSKGSLPWQGIPTDAKERKFEAIGEMKASTPIEVLCSGLPEEFASFLRAVRQLDFQEDPDYNRYRLMFRDLFLRSGFVYDYQYDWVIKSQAMQRRLPFRVLMNKDQPVRINDPEKMLSLKPHPNPPSDGRGFRSTAWAGFATPQKKTRKVVLPDWLEHAKLRAEVTRGGAVESR